MRQTSHILVVNGTKVRRPVFIVGAPHSGVDVLARALKRSPGFHVTVGRPAVVKMVYAFARRPSIATERGRGAARVLRDAYAESWQLTEQSCLDCPSECWDLSGGRNESGEPCAPATGVQRFADATPDLIYNSDVLMDAFPDAQLLQVIRDGRDVVAGMLGDDRCLTWFRPGMANLDEVFPNPFLGVEDPGERARWPDAGMAVKCALRWRGSVRLSARLRAQTPPEQLLTLRYEDMAEAPGEVAEKVSGYLGARISKIALLTGGSSQRTESWRPMLPAPLTPQIEDDGADWRERLTLRQVKQVQKVAGRELERLGYPLADVG